MKNAVRDFVVRMTGGNAAVAEICASVVAGEENGDVCRRASAEELDALASEPSVACFVDASCATDCAETPFVVCGGLLYTRRNWQYERNVANRIAAMAANVSAGDVALPQDAFYSRLRAEQREAVAAMCKAQFAILTGGPGTGKTHTIARAVKYLQDSRPGMRLALAAPTGKAAARMTESMAKAGIRTAPATTIHALLGSRRDLVNFRHGRGNPLAVDWLIVDEASMIGLPLMSKLLDALPEGCRLTLAGDVDQLASVEKGRVFGDLCRLPGVQVCRLRESVRFPPGGEISLVADAVNGNRPDEVMAILKRGGGKTGYVPLGAAPASPVAWPGFMKMCREKFACFAQCRDVAGALERLDDFRVLCALREGPYGADRLNACIKERMGKDCPVPVMVTRNDRLQNVANGDVGVVMPGNPELLHLPGENGGFRTIRMELLPAVELAFASTIHKSQGSEFGDVAIVLPPDGESPLLTREILYTGITRTKNTVCIYGSDKAVEKCCRTALVRVTGFASR
ncbi:MAG: exodeoxyribonuclease V subunit alpha [Kiritimatiellae bacterium]|nr:exodeoxyribonuclease V subunit alpha [Kiritimatiellia bacterium]